MLTDQNAELINNCKGDVAKVNKMFELGYQLVYNDIKNTIFKNNLLFIDCFLPQFLAMCLIDNYRKKVSDDMPELIKHMSKSNLLNYSGSNILMFYEYKMKKLLLACYQGMTPNHEWNGKPTKSKVNLTNQNEVEDYLFNNTKFDRASRHRYGFGKIYEENGNYYFDLNLQIRFKK